MVFTDPPYNVRINGHVSARGRHREFPMASGEMSPYEFSAFLERSFRLMTDASCDGAIHFVCMDWRHLGELLVAAAPIYGEPKQLCIWVKDAARGRLCIQGRHSASRQQFRARRARALSDECLALPRHKFPRTKPGGHASDASNRQTGGPRR
jgi:hypothetical protein